jgi:endonuclease G
VVAPSTKGTGIDAADQDAIVKQLVDALLQYILQLLR